MTNVLGARLGCCAADEVRITNKASERCHVEMYILKQKIWRKPLLDNYFARLSQVSISKIGPLHL